MVNRLNQRGYLLKRAKNKPKRNLLGTRKYRTLKISHVINNRRLRSKSPSPLRRLYRSRPTNLQHSPRPSSTQRHMSLVKTHLHKASRSPQRSPQRSQNRRRSQSKKSDKNTVIPPSRLQKFNPQYELMGNFITYDSSVSSSCPDIFKPTYVLSIRSERMNNFVQRFLPWMNFMKRPSCVIGAYLDKQNLVRDKLVTPHAASKLKLGEIGCFLSHLNAWKCIANGPYEYGSIFEDDAEIPLSEASRVNESMKEFEEKHISWDILFWCINPIPHVAASLQECRPLQHWKRVPPNSCMGGIAYTLKKHVAQSWVSRFNGITEPSDLWITKTFGQFNTYCINPILGFMVPTNESDTAHTKSPGYNRYLNRR